MFRRNVQRLVAQGMTLAAASPTTSSATALALIVPPGWHVRHPRPEKGGKNAPLVIEERPIAAFAGSGTNITSTTTPVGADGDCGPLAAVMVKDFYFGEFGQAYRWMGRCTGLAERLQCHPELEWFYLGIKATVPCSAGGEALALFMNDTEISTGMKRNTTVGTGSGTVVWDTPLMESLEAECNDTFSWLLTTDRKQLTDFIQEVYLQWYHRADYLVHRKSRQRKDFRQNLTFDQLMQEAGKRKRRLERRDARLKDNEKRTGPDGEPAPIVTDVLPRELREQLDREHDGMEDVRMARGVGNLSTFRSNAFR